MSTAVTRAAPATAGEVARLLSGSGVVRPVGGATKLDWGGCGPAPDLQIDTVALGAVQHNAGDLTAVLGAGVSLAFAQAQFAVHGQRLCLDPPDGGGRATIGGVIATGDSGPLRHRYGAVRDLILGVRVALPDGTVARAGSDVIKNVAGYDLAKLMCGALGTLGVVCEATLRLHPLAESTVTAVGSGSDPRDLARVARALARRPLELEALDLRWDGRERGGAVLARAAGHAAGEAAGKAAAEMHDHGLADELVEDDETLWAAQRERQRGEAVVRVSGLPTDLERILLAAPAAVARAGLGLAWVAIEPEALALADLRGRLPGLSCVLLDAPAAMRSAVDPWGVPDGPELELARRVKARFDPDGVCNPGRQIGGL